MAQADRSAAQGRDALRSPNVSECFNEHAITDLIVWNAPDHEHTRLSLRRKRRSSEEVARETVDAIRLTIEAAADDRAAVMVIRTILADGPPPKPNDMGSVRRLLRAIKRTRRAKLVVT